MNILIDTHILIWYTEGDNALSKKHIDLMNDTTNKIYISIVSFYEIAIKLNIAKLYLTKTIEQIFKQTTDAQINILPIAPNHLAQYQNLPIYPQHKDPFDRLIIATAVAQNLAIITADNNFKLYKELVLIIE